jgi:hypothetical protein
VGSSPTSRTIAISSAGTCRALFLFLRIFGQIEKRLGKILHLSSSCQLKWLLEVEAMQFALERLRKQVFALAERYSDAKTEKDLKRVFSLLEEELKSGQLQSQRIMVLMRGIMNAQPGTAKVVNEFLRNPKIAASLQAGGNYGLE